VTQKRHFDPLTLIPSPEVVRRHLTEAESLAERLRILLRVSEEIEVAAQPRETAETRQEGHRGD
jgi:hypothetical protein